MILRSSKKAQIRVGPEFQVQIPDYNPVQFLEDYSKIEDVEERRSICVWTPQEDNVISDEAVTELCDLANKKRFSVEQALAILQFSNFDYNKAVKSFDEYRSIRKEWSEEDKVLFEQALERHGKIFKRIKQELPHKSMGDLIQHYYLRKKKPRHTSFAEQACKKRKAAWIDEMDDLEDLERSSERENKRRRFDPGGKCGRRMLDIKQSEAKRAAVMAKITERRQALEEYEKALEETRRQAKVAREIFYKAIKSLGIASANVAALNAEKLFREVVVADLEKQLEAVQAVQWQRAASALVAFLQIAIGKVRSRMLKIKIKKSEAKRAALELKAKATERRQAYENALEEYDTRRQVKYARESFNEAIKEFHIASATLAARNAEMLFGQEVVADLERQLEAAKAVLIGGGGGVDDSDSGDDSE